MKKYLLLILVLLLVQIQFLSCNKFTEIDIPDNLLTEEKVFSSDSTATQALVGIYAQIVGEASLLNGNISRWGGLYSGEITRYTFNDRDNAFQRMELSASYVPLINLWNRPYQYILGCNTILENLKNSTKVSEGVKRQIMGESLLLRGLAYFYLINLFGSVPLVLENDYRKSAGLPRSAEEIVYDSIIMDLRTATELLTPGYPGDSVVASKRVRANKWAAMALLARVFLYRRQWQEAVQASTQVIESGDYGLTKDLTQVFKIESRETILQLQSVSQFNTIDAIQFSPIISGRPVYEIAKDLMSSFEAGDLRKTSWVKKVGEYAGVYKYKAQAGIPHTEYNILIRLSEVILIRSEAQARLGNKQDALNDLNAVRTRAGINQLLHSVSGDSLLLAIGHERQIELFMELSHRFFDLKRWMHTTSSSDPLKAMAVGCFEARTNWNTQKLLWPIPASEIEINSQLVQNPGY